MKVTLVRPNYASHVITPPLGLGYLSAYLKKHDIDAVIIDGLKDNLSQETLLRQIISQNPDVVGITCLTAFYNEVIELSRRLKQNKIRCIIGGVHPTFLPYQTLVDSGAEYVICGDGEIPFLTLIKNNFVNSGIQGVYSLVNLKKNDPVGRAEIIENLDDIPFPDWKQINPCFYPKAPHGAIVKNFPIGIITSTRGCPFECTFCASPGFCQRKIRYRSPESVVEEIIYLINEFKVKEIHFEDDNLTLKRKHIEAICRFLIENKIKIGWACPNGIRADCLDEELVILMKKSGCYYFSFGIESANATILQNIKKRETIDIVRKSIELASRYGIQTQGFFIFGLPGETEDSIEETIRFALSVPLARAQFFIFDVLPGCELWDKLSLKFTPNWNKESYREPEWIPQGLTREKLILAQQNAFRRFYLRPVTFFRLALLIKPSQLRFLWQRLVDYRLVKRGNINKPLEISKYAKDIYS